MDGITYYFGAGASIQSMPLVSNFQYRFECFIWWLEINKGQLDIESQLKDCKNFISEVSLHSSFDTYFKKLFHTNEDGDINRFKKIVIIYFIFEQLIDVKYYKYEIFLKYNYNVNEKKDIGIKSHPVDPRYDALIAGLLDSSRDSPSFLQPTNFITWNYDLNLMASLKNFFLPTRAVTDAFLSWQDKNTTGVFKFRNFTLIHLNGTAFHEKPYRNKSIDPNALMKVIAEMLRSDERADDLMSRAVNGMRFSWESEVANQKSRRIAIAKECVSSTRYLIIAGYSFPLFNRRVDGDIINSDSLNGKQVFIQDPKDNDVASSFEEMFALRIAKGLISDVQSVTHLKDVNSFFVPSGLMRT